MTTSTRRRRIFRRRLFNFSNAVYLVASLAMFAVGWLAFTEIPNLWGALIALIFLALAAVNLIALLHQPRMIFLDEEAMEIRYIFGLVSVPFERIERLHWRRGRGPLGGFRSRDVLKIELKSGKWISVDHLQGQLRSLRASLEKRIYG